MVLQYKGVGKWKDYLYGERAYIWLSLLAKTALAWQVFWDLPTKLITLFSKKKSS